MPVVLIPAPLERVTVCSGAVLEMLVPLTLIPVPAVYVVLLSVEGYPFWEAMFQFNSCPVVGAAVEISLPCIFTTVRALLPVASPVWVVLGCEFVMVKLGYIPEVEIPVPGVRLTAWSGAVLVIIVPVTLIPEPAE